MDFSTNNVDVLVGTMFMVMGAIFAIVLLGIPFILIGHRIRKRGLAARNAKAEVLANGASVVGYVTAVVHLDNRDINSRIPSGHSLSWRIDFTFTVGHHRQQGSDYFTGMNPQPFAPGLPVWVVFHPHDASRSALWPPLR